MKIFQITLLLWIGFSMTAFGQITDGITYQAVALDEKGKEIAGHDINGRILHSKQINVRFSIIEGHSDGNIIYQEEHSTYTDHNGLFSLVIGHGEVTSGSPFASLLDIEWGKGKVFLSVELDVKSSGVYKLMGVQQMMAVPFAFHSFSSSNVKGSNDDDPLNEIQALSVEGNTIYLSNGGFVVLPEGFSGDYNDLANVPDFADWDTDGTDDFNGDYNSLVNQPDMTGYLTSETDGSVTNEIQILSISNDTIYLTQGGFVKLPSGNTNDYNDLTNKPDFTNWDTDATNDFNGDFNNLSNQPDFTNWDTDATNDFNGDYNNLVNAPDLTGWDTDVSNDFDGDYNNLVNAPDLTGWDTDVSNDFDGDYNSLVNQPDLTGFLTSEIDGSVTNEIQILSISNDTVYLTKGGFVKLPAGFSGDYADLTNSPDFSGWDTDATNDFDGDYNNLSNQPDFTNWDTDAADDFNGDYNSLTNQPNFTNWDTDVTNDFNGDYNNLVNAPDLTGWDTDVSNDFDGDYNSLVNQPDLTGFLTSEIDGSVTNEIQILSISNDTVYLTQGGFVKLPAGFSGNYADLTNSPDFSGWDKDVSNDFSGNFNDLGAIPLGLSDGDDNTQLSEVEVDAYVSNNGYVTIESDPVFAGSQASIITDGGSGAVILDSERSKLQGLQAGAEMNIQVDWDEADAGSDAYILNKPILANVATSGNYDDLSNRPDLTSFATVDMLGQNLTNVADPVNDQDAATKAYVDILITEINNLKIKIAVLEGKTFAEMISEGIGINDLLNAGYTVADLLSGGVSVSDLLAAGVSISDLLAAGATVSDLLAAGASINELIDAGVSISELRTAGASVADLLAAGVSASDILAAGYGVGGLMANGLTTQEILDAGANANDFVGVSYQGGRIYYINGGAGTDGYGLNYGEGLIASTDNYSGRWAQNSSSGTVVTGAQSDYDGPTNTDKIISAIGGNGVAASICRNYTGGGYNDWYLPSIYELRLLLQRRGSIGGIFVVLSRYWSSTEYWSQPSNARICTVDGFTIAYGSKWNNTNYIRAVRRFTD